MTNTFVIVEKTMAVTFAINNGALVFKGVVEMTHGVESKEVFFKALGMENAEDCEGTVEFRKDTTTRANNVYTFVAIITEW
jgi:hypothetical protein